MTIAGGAAVILLDEPTAGMSHSETDYAVALIRRVTQGQDAGDGGARHEGGVRPCRRHHRAGLRRGDRLGTAAAVRANAAVQEAYLGALVAA